MRHSRIKELKTSEIALARLRARRARLDTEIAQREERREAEVLEVFMNAARRFKLGQLPVARIQAVLENLAQGAGQDLSVPHQGRISAGISSDASNDPRQGLVETFVRLTRHASSDNRKALESAGLRWNGRSGGWSGRVTGEALERLRDIFGERVKGPADSSTAAVLSDAGANGSPVDVEREAAPVAPAEEPPEAEPAVPSPQQLAPADARLPRTPFRMLPPPRR